MVMGVLVRGRMLGSALVLAAGLGACAGTPKGVLVPHRGVNRLVVNNGYASFHAEDRVAWVGSASSAPAAGTIIASTRHSAPLRG